MSSDIKLEETFVVVEGNALKVSGWDIMLDGGKDRRGSAGGDHRRALVHSPGDKLTINYNYDYGGGVSINGRVIQLNIAPDNTLFIGKNYYDTPVFSAEGFDHIEFSKNVPGALGPVLTLTNTAGDQGAGAAIDFNGYKVGRSSATARIQSIDDGNYSSDLVFYTKSPGSSHNPFMERLRIRSNGELIISGELVISRLVAAPMGFGGVETRIDLIQMLEDVKKCHQEISTLQNEVKKLKVEIAKLKNQ